VSAWIAVLVPVWGIPLALMIIWGRREKKKEMKRRKTCPCWRCRQDEIHAQSERGPK
jgi:hypothetical protein